MVKTHHGLFATTTLVGITGRKYHGKDTIGKILCDQFGFERLAFGDALKDACQSIFHFDWNQLHGNAKESMDSYWGVTPRDVYQVVGTELFRHSFSQYFPHIGTNLWVQSLERKYLAHYKDKKVVVTDVRFQNEIDMIHRHGGVILRVCRDVETHSFVSHESEKYIDSFEVDYELHNRDLKVLERKVVEMFTL